MIATNHRTDGFTNPITLAGLVVAVVAATAFFLIERGKSEPLIYLRYYRYPRFLMANLGMLAVGIFLMGVLIYFSLFVQSPDTLALSPVSAGAAVLPLTGVMFLLAVTVPRILAPYSAHWPVTLGCSPMRSAASSSPTSAAIPPTARSGGSSSSWV